MEKLHVTTNEESPLLQSPFSALAGMKIQTVQKSHEDNLEGKDPHHQKSPEENGALAEQAVLDDFARAVQRETVAERAKASSQKPVDRARSAHPRPAGQDVRGKQGVSANESDARPEGHRDPKVTALLALAGSFTPKEILAGIPAEDPRVVALRAAAALFVPEYTAWIVLENKAINPEMKWTNKRFEHFEHWLGVLCLLFNKTEQKDRYRDRLRTYFAMFEDSNWQGRRDCSKEMTGRLLRKMLGQGSYPEFVELLETASFKWVDGFEYEVMAVARAIVKVEPELFRRLRRKVSPRIRRNMDLIPAGASALKGAATQAAAPKAEAVLDEPTPPEDAPEATTPTE